MGMNFIPGDIGTGGTGVDGNLGHGGGVGGDDKGV